MRIYRFILIMLLMAGLPAHLVQAQSRDSSPMNPLSVSTTPGNIPTTMTALSESPVTSEQNMARTENRIRAFAWRTQLSDDAMRKISELARARDFSTLEKKTLDTSFNESERFAMFQILAGQKLASNDQSGAAGLYRNAGALLPSMKVQADAALRLLSIPRSQIEVATLRGEINTEDAEYSPVPELSGKRIFFTRKSKDTGEDIWVGEEEANHIWKARPLTELNSSSHESPVGISPDGRKLLLMGNYPGSKGKGDVFVSNWSPDGWKKPVPLPSPLNSEYFDADAVFAADNKTILFTSDRPGGYFQHHPKDEFFAGDSAGNTDLYVCFLQPDGSLTKPLNLGPTVNTPGSERLPYLYADNKTIYFASNGHAGLGGFDIYKSVRLDDTWTNWSEPENLGPQINGSGNDWGFRTSVLADVGYMARFSPSSGSSDIFVFTPLPDRARPATEIAVLKGDVKDSTGKPREADVSWQKENAKQEEGRVKSNPDTGSYQVPLQKAQKYEITVACEGQPTTRFSVKPEARVVNTPVVMGQQPVVAMRSETPVQQMPHATGTQVQPQIQPQMQPQVQPRVQPQAAGKTYQFYFRYQNARVLNRKLAAGIAARMKASPGSTAVIYGYTDTSGDEKYNAALSQMRALAIYDALVRYGVQPARLSYKGLGESAAAGRARFNRRAEVRVAGIR